MRGLILALVLVVTGCRNERGIRTGQVTNVPPSQPLQPLIDAAPAGTAFRLAPGVYRGQSITPKDGDSFIGVGIVDFTGAQILSFKPSGALWQAPAKYDGRSVGTCNSTQPMCMYDQDLYIDNVLQTPMPSSSGLQPGQYHFDHTDSLVYLPTDPAGHLVEMASGQFAFSGTATGVTISGITVEKYANQSQSGAIGADNSQVKLGTNWTVTNVEMLYNHGGGIYIGDGGIINECNVHHNGQIGVKVKGLNITLENTDIAFNNTAGFATGHEAGGSKFWATTNMIVYHNNVHDNYGPGLWDDTDNLNITYDSNTITDNADTGLLHEVSYAAVIKNNISTGNSPNARTWLQSAQILIQNSSYTQVYDNTVVVPPNGGNGISIINQNRGSGAYGPWVSAYDKVFHNSITYEGSKGQSGLADDTNPDASHDNSFDYNTYNLRAGGTNHWAWYGDKTWAQLQALGQEVHGTLCDTQQGCAAKK